MKTLRLAVITGTLLLLTLATPSLLAAHPRYNAVSTEVMVPSRGIEIPATVVLPAARPHKHFPLVVIHHGHGGGRNENGGLVRVAEALARAGIASIRFDFAGSGDSTEPFTKLSYTTMKADSDAVLTWAVRNLPVKPNQIGAFGYSEGSAVVAMLAGRPGSPFRAVSVLGPVADPDAVFKHSFGAAQWDDYYAEAQANGHVVITTQFGQVQDTSLEWFQETLQADPAEDLSYFRGRVQIIWGEADTVIPFSQVELFKAAAEKSAKSVSVVTIPDADHGYGFYSDQPAVDAALHAALVGFFGKALH